MITTLTIGGTAYEGGPTGRPAQGILEMELNVSVDRYWILSFSVIKCGSGLPFVPGVEVTVHVRNLVGDTPRLVFKGDLQRPEARPGPTGLVWAYNATDMKRRGDYVPVRGLDGSGTASFNLAGTDPLVLYTQNGKTVGQILAAILQATDNAAALNAYGVGAYASMSPPTLPSATLADFALLTIVPADPVQLSGDSMLNALEGLISRWHPQYAMWVQPDGTIRVKNVFAFTPANVALPANDGTGDDCDWPDFTGPDLTDCYTAFDIVGLDIRPAVLSGVAGDLSYAWSDADQAAWTIHDFLQPRDASDDGVVSAVTSTGCTIQSDHAATHWASNFWQAREGWIYLSGPGGLFYEYRQVTACSAMTAGGTATVTWSNTDPLTAGGYTRYRLVGRNSPLALVGRSFFIRDPVTGDLGRDTFVGSHLYPTFPKGAWIANLSGATQTFYPTAIIQWSLTGEYPWFEVPCPVELDPENGRIILSQPVVQPFGDFSALEKGYPTTFPLGYPADVKVVVPFNAGQLHARAPLTGYTGTAYTKYGLQRVRTIPLDTYMWAGDTAALRLLAQQHLETVQDAVVEGTLAYHGLPANFDAFTPGVALSIAASGSTTPLDGLNLPVRNASIRWHDSGPDLYTTVLTFSNLKRPFEGDSLYVHPNFAAGVGMGYGDEGVFVGGMIGGQGGMMDALSYQGMAEDVGADISADAATRMMPEMPNFDDGSFDGAEDASPGTLDSKAPRKATQADNNRAFRENAEQVFARGRQQARNDPMGPPKPGNYKAPEPADPTAALRVAQDNGPMGGEIDRPINPDAGDPEDDTIMGGGG